MSDAGRITSLDALRGFALFGILQVNILAFSSTSYGAASVQAVKPWLDMSLEFIVSALFELKFYLLFSALFGYSLTLQMQSAEKAGKAFAPRIVRRQVGLLVIGIVHAAVFFHGDILTTYAVLGLALMMLRNIEDRWLIAGSVGLIVLTGCIWLALAVLQAKTPGTADPALISRTAQNAAVSYRGDPPSIIRQHLSDLTAFAPLLILLQAPCAMAMFMVGFVLGRRAFFETPDAYLPKLRPAWRAGLLIGLPGAVLYAGATQFLPGTPWETAALAVSILTAPLFSMAMASGLFLLFGSPRARGITQMLAGAGRMALSNYLLQSVFCALVFHGYGLGLVNRLALAETLVLATVIYAGQLVVSRWWLNRWRYGPMEWLLRAVTTGRWPKWRREDALAA